MMTSKKKRFLSEADIEELEDSVGPSESQIKQNKQRNRLTSVPNEFPEDYALDFNPSDFQPFGAMSGSKSETGSSLALAQCSPASEVARRDTGAGHRPWDSFTSIGTPGTSFGGTPGTSFDGTPGTSFGTPGTSFGTPGTSFGGTPGTSFGTPGTSFGTPGSSFYGSASKGNRGKQWSRRYAAEVGVGIDEVEHHWHYMRGAIREELDAMEELMCRLVQIEIEAPSMRVLLDGRIAEIDRELHLTDMQLNQAQDQETINGFQFSKQMLEDRRALLVVQKDGYAELSINLASDRVLARIERLETALETGEGWLYLQEDKVRKEVGLYLNYMEARRDGGFGDYGSDEFLSKGSFVSGESEDESDDEESFGEDEWQQYPPGFEFSPVNSSEDEEEIDPENIQLQPVIPGRRTT